MEPEFEVEIETLDGYTIVNNYPLRDKNLSNKARGLLCFMLSLPPSWDYSFNGLVSVLKEGKKAIKAQLQELRELGYIKIEMKRELNGQFRYKYFVKQQPVFVEENKHEVQQELPLDEPYTQKGLSVKGLSVKDTQINTKRINTNKQDKLDKLDISSCDDKIQNDIFSKLNSLTKQLIKRNFIDSNDLDLYRYDSFLSEQLANCDSADDYKYLITVIGYVIAHMKQTSIKSQFAYFKTSVLENLQKLQNQETMNDDLEFYSEEYCSRLLDELNSSNSYNVEVNDSIFDDLTELYDSLKNNIPARSEIVP